MCPLKHVLGVSCPREYLHLARFFFPSYHPHAFSPLLSSLLSYPSLAFFSHFSSLLSWTQTDCYDSARCLSFNFNPSTFQCFFSTVAVTNLTTGHFLNQSSSWVLYHRKNAIEAVAARPGDVNTLQATIDSLAVRQQADEAYTQSAFASVYATLSQSVSSEQSLASMVGDTRAQVTMLQSQQTTYQNQLAEISSGFVATETQLATTIDAAAGSLEATVSDSYASLSRAIDVELANLALKADKINNTALVTLIEADLNATNDLLETTRQQLMAQVNFTAASLETQLKGLTATIQLNFSSLSTAVSGRLDAFQQQLNVTATAVQGLPTHADLSLLQKQITEVDTRTSVRNLESDYAGQAVLIATLQNNFGALVECLQKGQAYSAGGCQPTAAPATDKSDQTATDNKGMIGIIVGAVGCVLAIMAVIFIIATRRQSSAVGYYTENTRSKSQVAFENPMYADGSSASNPMYAARQGQAEEGAYSELQNPRIAADAEEDGGYMNVH